MRDRIKGLFPLFIIIGVFLVIGAVLIMSGVLPEESAREFHALTEVSIPSEMKVIQEPTLEENMFIYSINDVAQKGIDIAKGDARVKQVLDENTDRKAALTIAAVQPTVIQERASGKLLHSSAGQVIITANWQDVNGKIYSEPKIFAEIAEKNIDSYQQIWHVLVDLDMGEVTQLTQHADRFVRDVTKANIVRAHVNMFVPNAIVVDPGSTIRWSNPSTLPHNVVGILKDTAAASITRNGTGSSPENRVSHDNQTLKSGDSGSMMAVNSGFIQPGSSWQYRFDKEGIFNYLCTIHAEDGMRGTLIVSSTSSS